MGKFLFFLTYVGVSYFRNQLSVVRYSRWYGNFFFIQSRLFLCRFRYLNSENSVLKPDSAFIETVSFFYSLLATGVGFY